jgi:hypothetical protein
MGLTLGALYIGGAFDWYQQGTRSSVYLNGDQFLGIFFSITYKTSAIVFLVGLIASCVARQRSLFSSSNQVLAISGLPVIN